MEFATGALGALLPKLGQLLQDEYNLQKGAKKDIEFLLRELEMSQAALGKVGNMPPEQLDEQDRIWAREAREVSYDMEDIVDTFLVRIQGPDGRPSEKSTNRFIKAIRNLTSKKAIRNFMTKHDIGQEIKDIKERVKEMAERRGRYKVDAITPAKTVVDPRLASMYTKAADLVGMDGSMQELITRLTGAGDTSVQEQRIVSVVGFGGLGKTTLAKAVYDRLNGQFNCKAFVSIGRNPDFQKVFRDILINLDKQQGKDFNLAIFDNTQLINKLQGFLENKRYIIVIDDVWEVESWERIKWALIENSGSRIIVTTRNYNVGTKAGDVYELPPLSYDNSRKLFFGRISSGESKCADDQQDDEVSDKILKKCGGIPLAIITMASLLLDKPREDWSEVDRSIGFGHNEGSTQVENTTKILSFSYYELPPHLRACLLYLSVFPEDHFIEKTPLIWMWIAEGFVHEKQGISSFKIGEGYFNELVNRSMIQLVEEFTAYEEEVQGCRVHDMVLDLIRSISSEENFITRFLRDGNIAGASSSSSRTGQGKVRRLALQSDGTMKAHMQDMKQVRSFISRGCDIGGKGGVLLSSFMLVRVLAIHASSGQHITRQHLKPIQNLLHLRCLQLSGEVDFPGKEIAALKFLQTLDVDTHTRENLDSDSMGLPTQLRCLRLRKSIVSITPGWFENLPSLEELEIYIDSEGDVKQEASQRGFINDLWDLRELSVLRVCVDKSSLEHAQVNMLGNLDKLEHLSLWTWEDSVTWEEAQGASFLLSRHLRELFLSSSILFSRFPSSSLNASRLPILSHLSVHVDHLDAQDLRILGELPKLHYLYLIVDSTVELVRTGATDDACLFQKLRRCDLKWHNGVRLLSSEEDSGGVSIGTRLLDCSMLLGSGRNKGVAPTLLPSLAEITLWMHVRDFKQDGNYSHGLEYFASLQTAIVLISCDGASAAEVKQVETALQRAADVHPNRPTLTVHWESLEKMISQPPKAKRKANQMELE